MDIVDDGEIDFSDQEVFLGCDSLLPDVPSSSFLDELLKNTHTCTHTHTCNPPGPDKEHTHTCYHTHTQLFTPAEEEDSVDKSENHCDSAGKKRPLGNREAVRKYREKKKAHTAYLEEEVTQLRLLNQQLMKKLQSQAAIEAEVIRLRTLLSEFKGRINGELATFPAHNSCVTAGLLDAEKVCSMPMDDYPNSSGCRCATDVPCLHSPFQADLRSYHQKEDSMGLQNTCDTRADVCQARTVGHQKRGGDESTFMARQFKSLSAPTSDMSKSSAPGNS
eukprot:c24669_g1_i1 orf=588-1418(-)